jgi:hypothetical protein
MNVKAMEQLEEVSGKFNMFTDEPFIVEYMNNVGLEHLENHYFNTIDNGGGWLDIINEFSEYKEIINDFEAEEFEDEIDA